jgi:hypothetical protein
MLILAGFRAILEDMTISKVTIKHGIILTVFLIFQPLTLFAEFSGGMGEPNDPYQIATADDLMLLGDSPEDYDKHFILTADIDLHPNLPGRKVFDKAIIAPDTDMDTGEHEGIAFTGVFDGNDHTISHLTIVGDRYLGLFGKLDSGANISNLGMEAVDINVTGYYVGALVGYNYKGSIIDSYSTGTVAGDDRIGGLVGENWRGSITSSYSTASVNGDKSVGGLVGYNMRGSIDTCFNTGTVTGTGEEVGGLVGVNIGGNITLSYNTGTVTGTDEKVGGLVGGNSFGGIISSNNTGTITGTGAAVGGLVGYIYDSSIAASFNMGTVTGISEQVGGLVGYNFISNITTSYSTGAVSGDKDVGGLLGYNDDGSITASYSTGEVTGNEHTGGLVGYIGLVGFNDYGVVIASFWDKEISGQDTSAGGTGLTTAELQEISTFLNAGWDFIDENLNGTCDYWQILPGDYPRLRSPVKPEGLGTAQRPYLIRDAGDLGAVWFRPMAHYRLEASVDLSGIMWSMAVVPWFGGTFDGNGYEISNIHIQGGGYLGLFGQSDSGTIISNLGVEAIDIEGAADYVGAIVGYNNGDITKSFSTGTVSGDDRVGGLAGHSDNGDITSSYSAATVSGNSRIGGLVGDTMYGRIEESFNNGTVTGTYTTGGIVGENHYTDITTSYNRGTITGDNSVGGLIGCHWESIITKSYNTGKVTGDQSIGGLIGYNFWGSIVSSYNTGTITGTYTTGGIVGSDSGGSITSSKNTGTVSGDQYVGGLVAYNSESNINTSYNKGTVTGINDYVGGLVGANDRSNIIMSYSSGAVTGRGSKVGGLIGENSNTRDNTIAATFWDVETSGQTTSAGGRGKTTVEMQTVGTFLEAGWDFVDETENGTEDIWKITEGMSYPHLWWEKYGGGTGESNDPYLIYTAEQMNTIGAEPNDWDNHFKLMADIDLKDFGDSSFNLIGNDSRPFKGVFDGNGHTISNLTYAVTGDEEPVDDAVIHSFGLFRRIDDPNAMIRDLRLVNPDLRPAHTCEKRLWNVGALAGSLGSGFINNCSIEGGQVQGERGIGGLAGKNWGTISDCYTTCTVGPAEQRSLPIVDEPFNRREFFGGLVGVNYKEISNCYALGEISGEWTVGGLVGMAYGRISNSWSGGNVSGDFSIGGLIGMTRRPAQISHCYATGHVSGRRSIGGLVGSSSKDSSINNCYATGSVSAEQEAGGLVGLHEGTLSECCSTAPVSAASHMAGGLVGFNGGKIFTSWACGDISGGNNIGGLVGENEKWSQLIAGILFEYDGIVVDSYAKGSVYGEDDIGGLVGDNSGTVLGSYSTGRVTGQRNLGGLVGNNGDIPVLGSFWDTETSGLDTSSGGTGKTTVEMQTAGTFLVAGWDFLDETENGTEDTWWILEGRDYPKLWWEAFDL